MRAFRIRALVLLIATAIGCRSLYAPSPKPAQLVGVWVDSASATATDTVAWVLAADGADRTLHLHVTVDSAGRSHVSRDERGYSSWYVDGTMGDTLQQSICVQNHAGRRESNCSRFILDTLPTSPGGTVRRRLRIFGYCSRHHTGDRVLLERL